MKLTLVNKRDGNSSTFVIKGWLRGLLSLCLLGAPVAFGCFGFQVAWSDSPAAQIAGRVSGTHEGDSPTDNLSSLVEITTQRSATDQQAVLFYRLPDRLLTHTADLSFRHRVRMVTAGSPVALYKYGRAMDPAAYSSTTLS
ncbi:hypothetical protein GCM10011403_22490 [Pseudohongiella nitratireducens]|jgi:hypothetical protein|uniref:Uncharacterized protein n=1 Tax=Pseudohongiella nitratireducens TaxID=1768907 RepID=A0A916QKX1_9GAMM|nr:hypothetical protein [Pseudohongiella nitratireducens]MDF1623047.1 hypothetical protein [Pseudohongiella nitratireducens]GFZ78848.1 hypothetical protein GCM10011403_22490 [Pseudohongiella nitratireducens]